VVSINSDFTERKRAAEELRQERDFANNLIETAPAIVLVLDTEGRIVNYNPYMEDISGYKVDEMRGKDWFSSFLLHQDHERIRALFRQAVGDIQTRGNVNPIITKRGCERQIEWYDKTLKDAAGNVMGLLSIGQDITERLQAAEELRQSEARWRSLTQTSPDHILTLDTDLCIQFANFASPGLSVQELIGTPLYTYVKKARQAEIKAILQGVLRTGRDASYETVYETPDGSTIHYESRVTPRRLPENGEIIGLTLSARDITARVRMEERLRASLKEKEALLRELYHRTKNNMQVISSMLALRLMHIQDEGVLSIFRDVENRIQSMALVHQKLYQSQDLSRIDLKEYIADLVELLTQSYQVPLDKITTRVDVERALVLIDTAIPCGLILNELLSNTFKHAFPGDRGGEVKIRLRRAKDGTLALQVSDNGVGFPEGLDWSKSDTLGLQTVFGIAERQLRGKVSVETAQGVTWRIRFREDLYSPRV
jgi:PAS domain S-box-containing protein